MSGRIRIPKALREQVWLSIFNKQFEHKCYIDWCNNIINVFDFSVGHNIPVSKGGVTSLDNLKPICTRCNLSMSDTYTIDEWNKLGNSESAKELIDKIIEPVRKKRKLNSDSDSESDLKSEVKSETKSKLRNKVNSKVNSKDKSKVNKSIISSCLIM